MKINIKSRFLIIMLISLMVFGSIDYSYGINTTSNPEVISRGLVFNTGISSDQIRLIKDFFRARGVKNVPWGYDYDNRTKELVRNYQKEKGITVDGIVGKSTISLINKEIRDKKLKIGLRVPYTEIKGDMIIINKSSNTLYFLNNGKIKESYPVATGKTSKSTPDGKHKVITKYKNPSWGGASTSEPIAAGAPNNPLGKRWIGISYGGGGQYGMHGNSNHSSIGRYVSLGCIRMFNPDVESFYERVKMNTPTWIGDEETLINYGVKFKSNYQEKVVPEEKPKYSKASIKLNGKILKLNSKVINNEGTTYYPFRELLENINARVIWDKENRIATGILEEQMIEFYLDSNKYKINGEYNNMLKGQKTFIDKGKTYVPIRNLMEGLGYKVGWEQSTRMILIEDGKLK